MSTGETRLPWALLLCIGLLFTACRDAPPADQAPSWSSLADAWSPDAPLPPFQLVDQAGEAFSLEALSGGWVLMAFVFTRCTVPEACPRTMERLAEVQTAYRAREPRDGERPLRLLTLTLDPAHDTPDVLRRYGQAYGVEPTVWTLATGPEGLLDDALPSMINVLATPDPTLGIRHSVKAALLRPGLHLHKEWRDNAVGPEEVFAAMKTP
ncbi:MAG: SCO family protein [Myxococcota bacterium]|nr:SCO family protein [Myxococcota bacterium]